MSSFVRAGSTSEFKDGSMKKVTIEGKEILLAMSGGNFYAVGNRCPHMGGDLSAGTLQGTLVTCPRHGSQFDVTTGENKRWMKGSGLFYAIGKTFKSPQGLPKYNVKVEGDNISVEI
jgi:3-phenylpropionate/trans-cinnamate dioxygenase ferredoxin subunit